MKKAVRASRTMWIQKPAKLMTYWHSTLCLQGGGPMSKLPILQKVWGMSDEFFRHLYATKNILQEANRYARLLTT